MTVHLPCCRICAAMCELEVTEDEGRITKIRGDRNHPMPKGSFCIKGAATQRFHNSEDQLLSSLRRNARGLFDAIDPETARDETHARLADIVERHGPEAVALYCRRGANCNVLTVPAAKAWMDILGSPYIFSSMTVDQSAKWVTGGRMEMFTTGKHKVPDVETIVEPADEDDGARLDLCPPDVAEEIDRVPQSEDHVAGYPYRLISRRLIKVMNSANTKASRTRRRCPTNPIFINEEDMASLRLGDGVKLSSRADAAVNGRAQKDSGLRQGVIAISHGRGDPALAGEQESRCVFGPAGLTRQRARANQFHAAAQLRAGPGGPARCRIDRHARGTARDTNHR